MKKIFAVVVFIGSVQFGAIAYAAPTPGSPVTPAVLIETPAPLPGITLSIDNGQHTTPHSSTATYRILIRNDSGTDYPQALIWQMMPPGLSYDDADPAPAKTRENTLEGVRTGEIQWVRHLPAHGEVFIEIQASIGKAQQGKTKLATTACVMPDGKTRPMTCATDSDLLTDGPAISTLTIILIILAGAAITGGVYLWKNPRRRPASASNTRRSSTVPPDSQPTATTLRRQTPR